MNILDSFEILLLCLQDDDAKENKKREEQLIDFQNMLIAAQHVNGGGDNEVKKAREAQFELLSRKVGEVNEVKAKKEMAKYQWPHEMKQNKD